MLGLNDSLADPFYAFYRLSLIGSFANHGFYPLLMPFEYWQIDSLALMLAFPFSASRPRCRRIEPRAPSFSAYSLG